MVSRVSSRHWLLRDIRPTYVLLVMVAFVVGILIYFIDWSPVRHETAVRPQLNNGNNDNIDQRYTGSIIIPMGENLCWAFMLDNRTGNMRDGGYSKCDEVTRQFAEKLSPEGARLRDVGKAFRNKRD
jgi:hypothetical protein